MVYNTTALDNAVNLWDYYRELNILFRGWFGGFTLLIIFLISFIATKGYDTRVSFITSSGITSFFAILLWGLGAVSMGTVFIPVVMLFGGLIWFALGD